MSEGIETADEGILNRFLALVAVAGRLAWLAAVAFSELLEPRLAGENLGEEEILI